MADGADGARASAPPEAGCQLESLTMKLLLCCESYPPHRGGVQEVMRQIAERLAARGHDVTVATRRHPQRTEHTVNRVKIREFRAGGKLAYALQGEIDAYRKFVREADVDAILIMAAQQWSFDALWPVLDQIKARKVFIPCGFSCLYEPEFSEYFRQMSDILGKFDHLIFNAEKYRDVDFARRLGLTNFTVLPNGVDQAEFDQPKDDGFRSRLGIPDDAFVFLTVGNPIEAKGHGQVIDAFARLDTGGRPAALISVANWSPGGLRGALRIASQIGDTVRLEGWKGIKRLGRRQLQRRMAPAKVQGGMPRAEKIDAIAVKATAQSLKKAIRTDLKRSDLIQAYLAADLFVFASKVEYSPLVLFEAAAAGTPFLTVPVGNAEEIVGWTGGGMLCPAKKDDFGYTTVDPQVLAAAMARCVTDRTALSQLGATARERCRRLFDWPVVVGYYEAILSGANPDVQITDPDAPRAAWQIPGAA
jgi:glycosyltransferase involved in cell wall biosynthesis